jgi:probable F420-dependent oxidoreductase
MRRAWVEAEELGVDAVFTWDHFYPLFGALVMCNSYRNPQYLADALRTVDHISGGRLIVGIGSGWFERDYDEYGYEFGTAGSRLRELARDLPLFKERLAKLNPAAVGAMPIMIGGGGEKVTLRIVAEHAQLWHTFADVDTYTHKAEVLTGHCADVGRDPSEIEHIIGVPADQIADRAEGLVDAGVTFLTVGIGGDGTQYDLAPVRELVQFRDAHRH